MKTKALRSATAFLWPERWIRFSTKDGYPLSTAVVMGFEGFEIFFRAAFSSLPKKRVVNSHEKVRND